MTHLQRSAMRYSTYSTGQTNGFLNRLNSMSMTSKVVAAAGVVYTGLVIDEEIGKYNRNERIKRIVSLNDPVVLHREAKNAISNDTGAAKYLFARMEHFVPNKNDINLFKEAAVYLCTRGEVSSAIEILKKVTKLDPNNLYVLHQLGVCFTMRAIKDYSETEKSYLKIQEHKMYPEKDTFKVLINEARICFQKVLSQDANNSAAAENLKVLDALNHEAFYGSAVRTLCELSKPGEMIVMTDAIFKGLHKAAYYKRPELEVEGKKKVRYYSYHLHDGNKIAMEKLTAIRHPEGDFTPPPRPAY